MKGKWSPKVSDKWNDFRSTCIASSCKYIINNECEMRNDG